MWAILGLLLGAIYGSLVAARKFNLDGKINQALIGTTAFILIVTALVNRPLAKSLIAIVEPEVVQVDSSALVQAEEIQQPQQQKAIAKTAPIASKQEQIPEKITKVANETSIREIKEMGGSVKIINDTGNDLDLYISVYSNDTDSWNEYFLIHIGSEASPKLNVKSDRYRYYIRSQDGGDKYSPETPYTVTAYDGDFSTLIIK